MKPAHRVPPLAAGLVGAIAAAKLLLHLYAGRHYGYFTDELYYLACSRHLAWGYVDQPPLIALAAWAVRHTLGESLAALRLLPALAGTAEVVLAAVLARALGGARFAQALAALATLAAPGILGLDNLLTMNAFEPLFWLVCAWLALRIVQTGDTRLWLWFGLVAGIGLENKYSMAMFAGGIVLGFLLTEQRRLLASRWLWAGGAIALALFLPNLLWNAAHHFPFLELQANIRRSGRDVPLGPVAFLAEEASAMLPLSVPVWLAGLWHYFGARAGRPYRALGWAWLFTAAAIMAMSPRIYYLFPAFPLLFAAGGVAWEGWLARPRFGWVKIAYPALVAAGAVLAPITIPVLSPERYIRYTETMHLDQPRLENHKLGPLPQIYADQFGWQEMAAAVARVYRALPPEERRDTAIFAQNYGQAGAIDLFGPRFGLPAAISGHQSYWLWGPRGYSGRSMIVMGDSQATLERIFRSVRPAGEAAHPYSMPYNHIGIFYCQGLEMPMGQLWARVKKWE